MQRILTRIQFALNLLSLHELLVIYLRNKKNSNQLINNLQIPALKLLRKKVSKGGGLTILVHLMTPPPSF